MGSRHFDMARVLLAALPLAAFLLSSPARVLSQASATDSSRAPTADRADSFRDTLTQVDRIVRVFLDNDLFALRDSLVPTDFEYTHGVGAVWHWADAPDRLRRWLGEAAGCRESANRERGCLAASLGVRQVIYTPPSNETFAVPGQRPHAAFLGLSAAVTQVRGYRQRMLHVELGTTGQLAFGAPVQGLMHAVTGSRPELGWRNQLTTRPAFAVRAMDMWQGMGRAAGAHARVRGDWGLQVGTLRSSVFAGTEVQVAPDGRAFWTPIDGGAPLPLGPYLVTGARQELVARDLFVDGHPGGRGLTAVREPSVWQLTVGIGWRFAGGSSEYRHVRRAKEYAAQLRPHDYGAFVFTWYR